MILPGVIDEYKNHSGVTGNSTKKLKIFGEENFCLYLNQQKTSESFFKDAGVAKELQFVLMKIESFILYDDAGLTHVSCHY